jgi:azurin
MTRTGRFGRWCLSLVPLLIAVAPASGQPSAVTSVELQVGDNMRFTPAVITVRPGERVRVVLRGVGKIPKTAMAHNFVLLRNGTDPKAFVEKSSEARESGFIAPGLRERVIAATSLVGPGESVDVTFEAPSSAGEYTFLCTFPSHFKLGMKGQLIVK